MSDPSSIDGLLVQWGDRLFYPGNRIVRASTPRLRSPSIHARAAEIRRRIAATVLKRAPQVMVKVTGGGRGMKAIAAHFRYISKNGRIDIEDEQGIASRGKAAVRDLVDDWRYAGSYIGDEGPRREAFNVMLSMPHGTDPSIVLKAARKFAQAEFADHKYVMVLHEHQANPHVHLSVRAESKSGRRLNPRKADLHRWRESFAEKLRGWGVDAEATRQATRGVARRYDAIWQVKAREEGRLSKRASSPVRSATATRTRGAVGEAWSRLAGVLRASGLPRDGELVRGIERFIAGRDVAERAR